MTSDRPVTDMWNDLFAPAEVAEYVLADVPSSGTRQVAVIDEAACSFGVCHVRLREDNTRTTARNYVFPRLSRGDIVVLYADGHGYWTLTNPDWSSADEATDVDGDNAPSLPGYGQPIDAFEPADEQPDPENRIHGRADDWEAYIDTRPATAGDSSLPELKRTAEAKWFVGSQTPEPPVRLVRRQSLLPRDAPQLGELDDPFDFWRAVDDTRTETSRLSVYVRDVTSEKVIVEFRGLVLACDPETLFWKGRQQAEASIGTFVSVRVFPDWDSGNVLITSRSAKDEEWQEAQEQHPVGSRVSVTDCNESPSGRAFVLEDDHMVLPVHVSFGELTPGPEPRDWFDGELDGPVLVEVISHDHDQQRLIASWRHCLIDAEDLRVPGSRIRPVRITHVDSESSQGVTVRCRGCCQPGTRIALEGSRVQPGDNGWAVPDDQGSVTRFEHQLSATVQSLEGEDVQLQLDSGERVRVAVTVMTGLEAGLHCTVQIEDIRFCYSGPRVQLRVRPTRPPVNSEIDVVLSGMSYARDGRFAGFLGTHNGVSCFLPVHETEPWASDDPEVYKSLGSLNCVVTQHKNDSVRVSRLRAIPSGSSGLVAGKCLMGTVVAAGRDFLVVSTLDQLGVLWAMDVEPWKIPDLRNQFAAGHTVTTYVLAEDASQGLLRLTLIDPHDERRRRNAAASRLDGEQLPGRVVYADPDGTVWVDVGGFRACIQDDSARRPTRGTQLTVRVASVDESHRRLVVKPAQDG